MENIFGNSRNLSKRPFLVVERRIVPASHLKPGTKGWLNDPTMHDVMENVTIVDRVQDRHLRADLVIDVLNRKVIKSRTDHDHAWLIEQYFAKYQSELIEGIARWSASAGAAEAMAGSIAERMADEDATEADDEVAN